MAAPMVRPAQSAAEKIANFMNLLPILPRYRFLTSCACLAALPIQTDALLAARFEAGFPLSKNAIPSRRDAWLNTQGEKGGKYAYRKADIGFRRSDSLSCCGAGKSRRRRTAPGHDHGVGTQAGFLAFRSPQSGALETVGDPCEPCPTERLV